MSSKVEEPAGVYYSTPGAVSRGLLMSMGSISNLKKGLSAESAESVMKAYSMTQQDMADTLHTNPKTLRKKIKEDGLLDPLQGSLIAALAELYEKGLELFKNKEAFLQWLHFGSAALGGMKPYNLLDTFQGVRLIMSELDAISEGSFA